MTIVTSRRIRIAFSNLSSFFDFERFISFSLCYDAKVWTISLFVKFFRDFFTIKRKYDVLCNLKFTFSVAEYVQYCSSIRCEDNEKRSCDACNDVSPIALGVHDFLDDGEP